MKIIYKAFDGRQFDYESDCKQYEEDMRRKREYKEKRKVIDAVITIKEYCINTDNCANCQFYKKGKKGCGCMFFSVFPNDWNYYDQLNKKTF